jgi:hypothetical protein
VSDKASCVVCVHTLVVCVHTHTHLLYVYTHASQVACVCLQQGQPSFALMCCSCSRFDACSSCSRAFPALFHSLHLRRSVRSYRMQSAVQRVLHRTPGRWRWLWLMLLKVGARVMMVVAAWSLVIFASSCFLFPVFCMVSDSPPERACCLIVSRAFLQAKMTKLLLRRCRRTRPTFGGKIT